MMSDHAETKLRHRMHRAGSSKVVLGVIVLALGLGYMGIAAGVGLRAAFVAIPLPILILAAVLTWWGRRQSKIAKHGIVGRGLVTGTLLLSGGSRPAGGRSSFDNRYLLELELSAVDDAGEEHVTFATSLNWIPEAEVDRYVGQTVTVLWHPSLRNKALFAELASAE